MNKLTIYPITVAFLLAAWLNPAFSQFNIRMNVLSGTSTTTCTDPIGAADPQWAVNINGAGWVTYPSNGLCYANFPNEQFNQTYACLSNIPASIPVCFRAFENDATLFNPCTPVYTCQTELCITVPVPPMGTVPFTIALPAGGQSGGSVNMNIAVSGVPGGVNDAICNAIPLGVLQTSLPVGFPDTSIFNNFCATNLNEPDPAGLGGWFNNQGVWFTFTTSANPADAIFVVANNDPSGFGDDINLQLAIFESSNNTCTGTFTFITQDHDPASLNDSILFSCPKPNTTYFLMVDGLASVTNLLIQGWFGLQVTQLDVQAGSELRCTAENIGTVPLGGSITSPLRTNACSMNTNASPATAFGVQKSVWFTFTTPPSGHVFLQGTSSSYDPISLQIAVYRSSNGGCTGMVEVESSFTATENDEFMELNCLDPGTTYFIMVDGGANDLNTGIFSLTVTDAGNETPVTLLNPTVCFGETFAAGGNVYAQSGIYFDTLQLPGGCDSVVITELTVLTPLQTNLQVVTQGLGLGNTSGQLSVTASGGAGGYSFLWSNGQTTSLATNLVGGDNYCVTVTDANGCESVGCLVMPYFVKFVPLATASSLDCFGDMDGIIEFTASGGVAPYQFDWQNQNNTLSGSGNINIDGQLIVLPGLPGGSYAIHLSDVAFDTTILVQIMEPSVLQANIANVTNMSCFMECDGSISLNIQGGTAPYQTVWSNGVNGPLATGLCNGTYSATVTDANGCSTILSETITQPTLLETNLQVVNQGIGLGNTSGQLSVSTTGGTPNYSFAWSNGQTTSLATNLVGGNNYCVTVSDANGCEAISCLDMPYFINFIPTATGSSLDCFGDSDGTIQFTAVGGVPPYQFDWQNQGNTLSGSGLIVSDGQLISLPGLPGGTYSIHISDVVFDSTVVVQIAEPSELVATIANASNATCFMDCDGAITLNIVGGNPPYQTIWSNGSTGNSSVGLCAGQYTITVTDANGCSATVQEMIIQPSLFTLAATQEQAVSCFQGSDGKAKASASENAIAYLWSNGETTSVINGLIGGTYSVTATNAAGCTASASVTIQAPTAPVSVVVTEVQGIACQGDDTGELLATTSGPGTNFSFEWSNTGSQITNPDLPAGTYTVTVTNENGCSATASATLIEPTELEASFSTNTLTCLDPVNSGIITVDLVTGGNAPYSYSSNGIGFSQSTEIAGYAAGTMSFFVQDAGGCVKEFMATIEGPEELLVDLGEDQELDLGDSIRLSASVSQAGSTYLWTPSEGLSCNDCPTPFASPKSSQTYQLVVTTPEGCTNSDEIFIQVKNNKRVFVPNAFSPNGDGINDEFLPFTSTAVASIKSFQVFDRQGNMVFEAKDMVQNEPSAGWNGEFRGKRMQPAVFAWLAEIEFLDGKALVYQGDVVLVH